MPRIEPLAPAQLPEFADALRAIQRDHGYVPNSFLTMGRHPALLHAMHALAEALWYSPSLGQDVRRLVAFAFSMYSGAMYSAAHTACGAEALGLPVAKLLALHDAETAPVYTARDKALLALCRAAARSPSEVRDRHLDALRGHFSEGQLVRITGLIAWHALLNTWNGIVNTRLEPLPRRHAEQTLAPAGWLGHNHT